MPTLVQEPEEEQPTVANVVTRMEEGGAEVTPVPSSSAKKVKPQQVTLGNFFKKQTEATPVVKKPTDKVKMKLKDIILGKSSSSKPKKLLGQFEKKEAAEKSIPGDDENVENGKESASDAASKDATATPDTEEVKNLETIDTEPSKSEATESLDVEMTDADPEESHSTDKEDIPMEETSNDVKDNTDAATEVITAVEKEEPSEEQDDAMEVEVQPSEQKPKKAQPKSTSIEKSSDLTRDEIEAGLTKDFQDMLAKHESMRSSYREKALQVLEQCIEESQKQINFQPTIPTLSFDDPSVFPDDAVPLLLTFVEGQSSPLSQLTETATKQLNEIFKTSHFTNELVESKIKVLATRKQYIKNPQVLRGEPAVKNIDIFEDVVQEHMWRWEATVPDVLPELSTVKKRRTNLRKITSQLQAMIKLLSTLNQADNTILKGKPVDAIAKRLTTEEEKVLKFEREDEKARLAKEAKHLKEQNKVEEQKRKQAEKSKTKHLSEEKKLEKERLKKVAAEEKERKKTEAELAKEEAQRKKAEEAALKAQKKKALLDKQKNCMIGFFAKASTSKPKLKAEEPSNTEPTVVDSSSPETSGFDQASFRKLINCGDTSTPLFKSSTGKRRKRSVQYQKTKVYVTVGDSENPFAAEEVYAEEQEVTVRLPKKFLRFHEDVRPPYIGTWSKKSSQVTGRTPFGQDNEVFDYEYDSECEWEEGDDEVGEDIEEDIPDDDEEKDPEDGVDPEAAGWLAGDDDLGDDADEETIRLRKQRLLEKQRALQEKIPYIIGPIAGRPIASLEECVGRVQNYSAEVCFELLQSYTVETNSEVVPDLAALFAAGEDDGDNAKSEGKSANQDMTAEEKKEFARQLQGRTTGSKEKVLDEIREAMPLLKVSRAHTLRHLESIGEKVKHPISGSIWQVKPEALKELGMEELIGAASEKASDAMQNMKAAVARGVHHNTCNSKEKLVEQLQNDSEIAKLSKSETLRMIESIADKKKHPIEGYYWQVRSPTRKELNLTDLAARFSPKAVEKTEESTTKSATKAKRKIAPTLVQTEESKPSPPTTDESSAKPLSPAKRKSEEATSSPPKKPKTSPVPSQPPLKKPSQTAINLLQAFTRKKNKN